MDGEKMQDGKVKRKRKLRQIWMLTQRLKDGGKKIENPYQKSDGL
jgi:hypothetical protein